MQLTTDFVPGATYYWTGPNNFNSTQQNPQINPIDESYEGDYFVSLVINGCVSATSSPLLVEIDEAPEAAIALNGGAVCLGNPNAELVLMVANNSAITGATYTWYEVTTNNIIAGPTTSLTTVISDLSNFDSGTHQFYVIAEVSGCPSSESAPTVVEFNEAPLNQAFAGDDIFVCDNNSVMLNAQAPTIGDGQWTQVSGMPVVIANPNQANTNIAGLIAGENYTFAWTLSDGSCANFSTDEVEVSVDVAVAEADAGVDFDLCNATSTNLNATPVTTGITGTWSQPFAQALLGVTIVDPNNPNTEITGLMPGNNFQFIWTLSNAGCGDFASDIIVVTNEGTTGQQAFGGVDLVHCGIAEVSLDADEAPVGSIGTWTSSTTGVNISSPNISNTLVTELQPGENIFTWTLSNPICGEYSSAEVTIYFEPTPIVNHDFYDIGYNSSSELEVLVNDIVFGSYNISFSEPSYGTLSFENEIFIYSSNLTFVGTDEFTYEICSELCPDECATGVVALNIGMDATCTIPNIFSPNNDGINDEFIVPCLSTDQFPNNEVSIFNQWGDEVFRTAEYLNDWKGTYKGEDLPTGTYFFVVDFGDGLKPKTGFLILER